MMPIPNLFCLLCKRTFDISSCINIFCTALPRNGELLANFISKVLRATLSELNDSYVCSQCYKMFEMLEQAQKTVLNIRCEILKIYCAGQRRKTMKQLINNDAILNARTVLEENKLDLNGKNLQPFPIKELVKQQCIKNKVTDHVSNLVDSINIETTSTENIRTYDNNNSQNNVKKRQILKNGTSCHSLSLINDNNIYNIDSSEVNICTVKLHTGERSCFSSVNSGSKLKSLKESNPLLSDNKLQVQNITESIESKCKKIDENALEINESTGCSTALKAKKAKVPAKSEKASKLKPKSFTCSTCGTKWNTSAELKIHVKTHASLKPYMCEKCGQAYKRKHALEVHVGMHNGINPFQCNFCNKCFSQKVALIRHLPMHTGETPYQCELCGKRFIHHTSYNMHKLSHSGKKSYKCHICDLSFLSTSHLKRHTRAHSGEKPYSCTLCGKRFTQRYNLLAHQKIHNPFENKTKKAHADGNSDLKNSCTGSSVEPESNDLSRNVDAEDMMHEKWIQMNHSKSEQIDTQTKLVLLQNPLPEIDESSFAVTFDNQRESTNYNASLQVITQSSDTSIFNKNLSSFDKTACGQSLNDVTY
ncbi:uncharacterized protein LOC143358011 [Halictus rubicundus]|uniref:uncharacterized protein LOC143358011 n=1 Tax=Halictus rubicundus TaxID=77578 RepID=UPI004036D17C